MYGWLDGHGLPRIAGNESSEGLLATERPAHVGLHELQWGREMFSGKGLPRKETMR
jgi:hypothetical protein